MPLRDHFENPDRPYWDRVHGLWPAVMVQHLFKLLPARYHVAPQVHLGSYFEVDIATYEDEGPDDSFPSDDSAGGVATALQVLPEPTLTIPSEFPEPDEYEVRIFDAEDNQRLVAVIELVSPSNKDRPESRRAFVSKCLTLLQQDVCVSIVDLVTIRPFNLYMDLLEELGKTDPTFQPAPSLYAATLRRRGLPPRYALDLWSFTLTIGQPLPGLPIGLLNNEGVVLDLEATYEETCRTLRIT